MKHIKNLERSIHDSEPETDVLSSAILTKSVPRLLRPMETGGNKIKPVLLHGKMCYGNAGMYKVTGEPILYDPGSFYGHGEYEVAPWRAERHRFDGKYLTV